MRDQAAVDTASAIAKNGPLSADHVIVKPMVVSTKPKAIMVPRDGGASLVMSSGSIRKSTHERGNPAKTLAWATYTRPLIGLRCAA